MRCKQILPLNEASSTPLFFVLPQAGKAATPWSLTKQKYDIPNCHGIKGLVDLQPKPYGTGHWPFSSKEMILIDYATIIYTQPHCGKPPRAAGDVQSTAFFMFSATFYHSLMTRR